MFHTSTSPSPSRPARWDRSVPLSRARIPLFVLQDRLCSVHAAGAFAGSRPRLCAVNVKLTMQLGIGAGLLVSAHSNSRVFSRGRRVLLHRVVQTGLVVARGGVGCRPGASCEKISTDEGGLLRPSLFLWRLAVCGAPVLPPPRQAA